MSYQSQERERLIGYARATWNVDGHVLPFALASENLHESVRASALDYFRRHRIKWWTSRWDVGRPKPIDGDVGIPTGHLNSSQVACVNHLEPVRLDRSFAYAVVRTLDPAFVDVEPVEDDLFVAYEWIGKASYLGEPGPRVRGANITSLDALMCARRADATRTLVVIEWKYLERYGLESVAVSKKGTDRVATYRPLLEKPDCPIRVVDLNVLFFEPYYQLMRQTLLAWKMAKAGEFGADSWLHVHVVPDANVALRRGLASPTLAGDSMETKWRSVLKDPGRYVLVTPGELLANVDSEQWPTWRSWLSERYQT